ncbi:MAG: hypothetical protein CL920_30145 [Deltaproteobacteria bacterium]|nr:hypothetical protein [Deltaproteobacteria bacterium]MBU52974.1 hypothetical protein [Deltaproteobacteria bacterium]|tara:strand:+ start:6267 stop:6899 length:633 start_codon:yes stop_codon:yes gene_type:complete
MDITTITLNKTNSVKEAHREKTSSTVYVHALWITLGYLTYLHTLQPAYAKPNTPKRQKSSTTKKTNLRPITLWYKGTPFISYAEHDHKKILMRLEQGRHAISTLKYFRQKDKQYKHAKIVFSKLQSLLVQIDTNMARIKKQHATQRTITNNIIQQKDALLSLKEKQYIHLQRKFRPLHQQPIFWLGIGAATLTGIGVGIGLGVILHTNVR